MVDFKHSKTAFSAAGTVSGGETLEDTRVANWYRDLRQQLVSLEPFLVAGRIVTFQNITPEEKAFFEELIQSVQPPEGVCAVFIPPSIVQQAMWPDHDGRQSSDAPGIYKLSPDAGAVAAQRCGALSIIVNALFAFPPMTPGIDVYEDGRLLAGYTYRSHQECAAGLSEALNTFLT